MLKYLSEVLDEDTLGLAENIMAGSGGGKRGARIPGVCPVSDDGRLVVCGFLGDDAQVKIPNSDKALPRVEAPRLVEYLKQSHGSEVSILTWNFSGVTYNYRAFDDNVAEHSLGLHPAPPMALLVPLIRDIVSWLNEDKKNVAVIHDLGGRRSAVIAACCLLRMRQLALPQDRKISADGDEDEESAQDFVETQAVLKRVGQRLGKPGSALVPSQLRYVKYYAQYERETNVSGPARVLNLDKKLSFQRLIVNGIPDFVHSGNQGDPIDLNAVRCTPFIKIVQGQSVVAGTLPANTFYYKDLCFSLQPKAPFPTKASATDAVTAHDVPVELQGDVLVKCYNQDEEGKITPMFAVAFHTAFVSDGVLRVSAQDIDGARHNGRFPRDFFVDLIFAYDPDKETADREEQSSSGGLGDAGLDAGPLNGENVDPQRARRVPMKKLISRQYMSAFSQHSTGSSGSGGTGEPRYSLADDEEVEQTGKKKLAGKNISDDSTAEVGGLIGGFEGLDEDLAAELEKYTHDLENIDSGKGQSGGKVDIELDMSEEDDDEEFDIDAFASSLDLDP